MLLQEVDGLLEYDGEKYLHIFARMLNLGIALGIFPLQGVFLGSFIFISFPEFLSEVCWLFTKLCYCFVNFLIVFYL